MPQVCRDNNGLSRLNALLGSTPRVLLAFSGGVDSTFLLKALKDRCPERLLAVTARSPAHPRHEVAQAEQLAAATGVEHLVIDSDAWSIPEVVENHPRRCYYCKWRLFSRLKDVAEQQHLDVVMDGSNRDDHHGYRPGIQALTELGIRSPLLEAGLGKEEIRSLSKELGLPTWEGDANSCLMTRFPYGTTLTREGLRQVDRAETILRDLGYRQVRVRIFPAGARIEVDPRQVPILLAGDDLPVIRQQFFDLGLKDFEVDPKGYCSGTMDKVSGLWRRNR